MTSLDTRLIERDFATLPVCPPEISRGAVTPAATDRVRRACTLLLKELAYTPSLAELSRAVGSNRCTLAREFRAALGVSPFAWLRGQRLGHAKRLLRTTDWPIYRIADAVGYPDQNHFSTLFKRHFGLSPRQFRQRGTANDEMSAENKESIAGNQD